MFQGLLPILACPDCRGKVIEASERELRCQDCGRSYEVTEDGIIRMMPSVSKPLPDAYNDPDYQRMSRHFDDSSAYFTDGNSLFHLIHESAHRKIASWIASNPREGWICDIGCGQGYHYRFVKDLSRTIGIDVRLESLRRVRAISNEIPLIQGDSCALPFQSGSIAGATSVYTLEHVYYLAEALAETARILEPTAPFYVGLPCEGGLAWTLGRKLTSERTMSKRYNVDYRKYIALEHCNTARRVIAHLGQQFKRKDISFFPLPIVPIVDTNLTVALAYSKSADA